jgi:hypothetical protein
LAKWFHIRGVVINVIAIIQEAAAVELAMT